MESNACVTSSAYIAYWSIAGSLAAALVAVGWRALIRELRQLARAMEARSLGHGEPKTGWFIG